MNQKLSDWANVAEITGTLAVVVSLLLVVRSVDQNTRVIESTEESRIWDTWREIAVLPLLNGGELAAVRAKVSSSEALSDAEQIQWDNYLAAQLDIWAQLFDKYSNGLITRRYWEYWDSGFRRLWDLNDYNEAYEAGREFYDPAFINYIDTGLSRRSAEN